MNSEELNFLEEQLTTTEPLFCAKCNHETLHGHLEVLETYPQATKLLMRCTHCLAT